MANIINNNFHNLKLLVNKDEYWDFFINKSNYDFSYNSVNGGNMYDKCLFSYIDMALDECKNGSWINSTNNYFWDNAIVTNYTLFNIGYTGADNGLISFSRDRIDNKTFLDIYTKSTYEITEDKTLKLHAVSGSTKLYDYDLEVLDDSIKLNGGFYQGFFGTDCKKYMVLPSKLEHGDNWNFEFVLKKEDFVEKSDKTLNDKYPNNKGLFFYIGTRAENKWIYLYDGFSEKDECSLPNIDNYVEDVKFDAKTYKLNNFLDVSFEMPTPYEEVFMDDYMNFKYFSEDEYSEKDLEKDDFFMDDYLDLEVTPKVIDEENLDHKIIGWCCNYVTEKKGATIRRICCGCGACKPIHNETNSVELTNGSYFSSCSVFGDDYIEDIDDLDDGTDFIEADLDISDFDFKTNENGFSLNLGGQYYIDTDNKFLLFDRTCSGFNVKNYTEGDIVRYYGRKYEYKDNLFLLLNRTCTGYTVNDLDSLKEYKETTQYNVESDLYENALGFRITDDGAIGYRYYTVDCEANNKTTIREGYSNNGVINDGEWVVINVRLTAYFDTMVLRFYVNGKLVFVSDEMRKLNLRKLNDIDEKQEGVPFNISLGGGTQGLIETVLPNYMLDPYRVYPLEENFAGTFIGFFKSFKFYGCKMEYNDIFNNFLFEKSKMD